mgnify:CR=1 FL=1
MEVELMPGYMLEVPAGVDIPYNQENTDVGTVCVSMMVLEPGKQLKIRGELENLRQKAARLCPVPWIYGRGRDRQPGLPIRVHIGNRTGLMRPEAPTRRT